MLSFGIAKLRNSSHTCKFFRHFFQEEYIIYLKSNEMKLIVRSGNALPTKYKG